MKTLGKILFYLLFAFGAIRLFKGLNHLWPLLYGYPTTQPTNIPDSGQSQYYRFDDAAPIDNSQVILLIISGLVMIVTAFIIRNKLVGHSQPE
ncbi:MAG: hypothetical protein GC192_18425 [Bacteroidetes bacterium]|nr:hypothetical protein [Bacteroidota bacterium]